MTVKLQLQWDTQWMELGPTHNQMPQNSQDLQACNTQKCSIKDMQHRGPLTSTSSLLDHMDLCQAMGQHPRTASVSMASMRSSRRAAALQEQES